jgi:hypothetical protein
MKIIFIFALAILATSRDINLVLHNQEFKIENGLDTDEVSVTFTSIYFCHYKKDTTSTITCQAWFNYLDRKGNQHADVVRAVVSLFTNCLVPSGESKI